MLKLLDCTLRDGGYLNNWEFGSPAIPNMISQLEKTNVDIIELGFLRNERYNINRTVFNDVKQIDALIPNKRKTTEYAAMIEAMNPLPVEMLSHRTEKSIDIIRVIIWKTKHDETGKVIDALQEGFDCCKGIIEKGYKLYVQPARVDQYSDYEFVTMLKQFERLNPAAIYIVDSWGIQNVNDIIRYITLADQNLGPNIAIGYHGHNSLMQAFATASVLIHSEIHRDIIVDGSIYGIGRGSGNLNIELFAKYLNETENKYYNIAPMISMYQDYIKPIYDKHPWGYNIAYFLTAQYKCNHRYGEYLGIQKELKPNEIERVLCALTEDDKIMFSVEKAEKYLDKVLMEN